jgi:hypothetical protein
LGLKAGKAVSRLCWLVTGSPRCNVYHLAPQP